MPTSQQKSFGNRMTTALSFAVVGVFALALAAVFALLMTLLMPTPSEAAGVPTGTTTKGAGEHPPPGVAPPARQSANSNLLA